MNRIGLTLLTLVALSRSAAAAPLATPFELKLQASLELERETYADRIQEAVYDVVDNFACWGFAIEPRSLVRHVQVFADLQTARTTIAKAFNAKPEDLPETFGGLATNDQFYLASPELFRKTWDKQYGAAAWNERTYHRLMMHELSHTAHAQFAVKVLGDEEQMGPTWFFEGFACYSAGQFSDQPALARADFTRQLAEIRAGKQAGYPAYARMVSTLAAKVPVPVLLRHAGDKDFPEAFLSQL